MPTTWIAAAAALLSACISPCLVSPAFGQVDADAKALLSESAEAVKNVRSITFEVKTHATGMLRDLIDLSGSVKVWRPVKDAPPTWRVDGRAKNPGRPDRELHVVSDSVTVQWLDAAANTLFIRPATDPAAQEVANLCRELVFAEWSSTEPFAMELANYPILERTGLVNASGEICDQVRAMPNTRDRARIWAISAADRLPRQLELDNGQTAHRIAKTTEISQLQFTRLASRDFDLRLNLQPGYFVDEHGHSPVVLPVAQASDALSSPAATRTAASPPVMAPKDTAERLPPRRVPIAQTAPDNNPAPVASDSSKPAVSMDPTAPVAKPDSIPEVHFAAPEIEMPLDAARPVRVIPVTVAQSTDTDRPLRASSDQPSILTIDHPGTIFRGQTFGYILVRPLAPGEASIRVGDSAIRVRVTPAGAASSSDVFGPTPRLLSPSSGAAVWETVRISAACWRIPGEPADTPIRLRLLVGESPDQIEVEPTWTSPRDSGPLMLASFTVDFSTRPPGPCPLRILRTDAAGTHHSGEASSVQVVRVRASALLEGECETDYGLAAPNLVGPPKAPPSQADKTASGGRFFPNASADPRFRFPLEVSDDLGAGWYQVMLTAAGDASCAALPSVGITIDDAQRPTTASAIADPAWHRTPIGTPFRLAPGFHIIRCDFVNDFASRGTDRNLRLDRIEIARVAQSEPSGASRRSEPTDTMMSSTAAAPSEPMTASQTMTMMSGATGGPPSGAWPASARATSRPPVRVALERPIDGQPIAGLVEIRGTVWWEDQRTAPPPLITLLINGKEVQSQRSDAPRFVVPVENFTPTSTVALRATADYGFASETAAQTLTLPASLASASKPDRPLQSQRLTVHDPVWNPPLGKSLKDNQGGEGRKSAPMAVSSQVAIDLPESLEGTFDIALESRAVGRERMLAILLERGPQDDATLPPRPVAWRPIPTWYESHLLTVDAHAPLILAPGPKRLILAMLNPDGSWTPGKGEKNALWFQALRLLERSAESASSVALVYPDNQQEMFGADALIAEVATRAGLDWAEAVIDNKPTGLRFDLRRTMGGIGRVLVPLALRNIAPGEHQVHLRISDTRGHLSESAPRTIRILAAAPPEGTTYDRAITLLDRFAYGPDQRELIDALRLGPRAYLQSRLDRSTGPDASDLAATDLAAVRFSNPRSGYDVPRRAIQQAIATGNPIRNRFTLWTENHFSTWIRKTDAWRKQDEHDRFSALGIPRFYDLLAASATSPAMLRYLDQERSYGGRLNENYAREIMELHTLGVNGGYTQQDVTNLAHVLTGWTTARTALASTPDSTPDDDGLADDFRFEPILSASLEKPRDVFGYRFEAAPRAERHQRILLALELLTAHPATARFVCTKLVSHYVAPGFGPVSSDSTGSNTIAQKGVATLIDDLAAVFLRTGGDMQAVLLAMSDHPAFWQAIRTKRLAHPTDYAFRLARTSFWMNPNEIGDFLGASGHGLFDRPTPDGYPELDADAMDSNAILQRWKLASKADGPLADAVPPSIRWSTDPITPDLAQTIVDLIAIRLTGRPLGDSSNTQALEVLTQSHPALPATNEQLQRDPIIRTVATFIAQMPEANVR